MADNSTIFSGSSRYSNDFQQIIERTINIASLPLSQLNNQKNTLTDQQAAWTNLQSKFVGLRVGLTGVVTASQADSALVRSSSSGVATAVVSDGALAGEYVVDVVDTGSRSSAFGVAGVADPASEALAATNIFSLTANGETIEIETEENNLNSLVEAINRQTDIKVKATLVNVASTGQPAEYRISLQSGEYNADSISLSYEDAGVPQQLLGTTTAGATVKYRLNGFPAPPAAPIESTSRKIAAAPGLSIEVVSAGTATLTVSNDSSTLTDAITSFVNSYNGAITELDKHRGKDAGVLGGNTTIGSLSQVLRGMVNYKGVGEMVNMAEIGLTFNSDGKLQFNSNVIANLSPAKLEDAAEFLGTPTGGGLLKRMSDALSTVDNAASGLLPNEIDLIRDQLATQTKLIADNEERIALLEENLIARMSAADAQIAALEQQVQYYTNLFQSMSDANKMYS